MTISATTQGIKPGVCTSTNRPVAPFDGQVIYMTDVDQTAVWDGTQWTVLAPIAGGRNRVINGAMQVAQRNTNVTGITTSGYYTADRYASSVSSLGTWTQSVEADAPTGSGLRKSVKMLCTTADASPAAGDLLAFAQFLEGQNVQQFLKGTSSAKQMSLSFWVKSNVTGTYIVRILDADNIRQVCASYTVSASATWEKKTITFPADTTGVLDNDNNTSLFVQFWLAAGSNYTSGTLQTTWATETAANIAVGQTNLGAAINNYWQVTGVQFEAGAVATPFEFEDFNDTFSKCQRYFQRYAGTGMLNNSSLMTLGVAASSTVVVIPFAFPTKMRTTPSSVTYGGNLQLTDGVNYPATGAVSLPAATSDAVSLVVAATGATQYRPYYLYFNADTSAFVAFNAEL